MRGLGAPILRVSVCGTLYSPYAVVTETRLWKFNNNVREFIVRRRDGPEIIVHYESRESLGDEVAVERHIIDYIQSGSW